MEAEMMRRLGLTTVAVLLTVSLSGCIYVGGTRHYHGEDDGYSGDRYDRPNDRYNNDSDRHDNNRHNSNYYQDEYRSRQSNVD